MENLSDVEILSIKEPGLLFTGDPRNIENEYKELAMQWHPDRNRTKDTTEVMSRINELYDLAIFMLEKGIWIAKDTLTLKEKSGVTVKFPYKKHHQFELGDLYINDHEVIYVIDKINKDLFDNARKAISNFKFKSDRMKQEVLRYLPEVIRTFETADERYVMEVKKTPDLLILKDVLEYHTKNPIPDWDRHVAWIQSTLHNLVCYFEVSGITHNSISLDTYFISPEFHSGALLGGWWYSIEQGRKMIGVPARTFGLMPLKTKESKEASIKTDLELLRSIGRELLGDSSGVRLLKNKVAPPPMINWLRSAPAKDAIKDYKLWQNVLTDSFGPRKFVKLELTSEILYGK
jgi:hypothetical protein